MIYNNIAWNITITIIIILAIAIYYFYCVLFFLLLLLLIIMLYDIFWRKFYESIDEWEGLFCGPLPKLIRDRSS